MNKNDIKIHLEKTEERREVENLVREAFWNVYRPGCLEHFVLNQLRFCSDFITELNFVMEMNGKIIGQIVFVRAVIKSDDGREIPISTMGPICVAPRFQGQGLGKMLLDYSLEKARKYGVKAVCIEGNYNFYSKSGFDYARKFGIRYHGLPQDLDDSFFLCKELEKGCLNGVFGEYSPPDCYMVDENEAEEFDKTFPPKIKLKLDSQIF